MSSATMYFVCHKAVCTKKVKLLVEWTVHLLKHVIGL